jgi:solute carrier family 9B (sodium/hydrogen exchanger), member 1/2
VVLSIAVVIFAALFANYLFQKLRLPGVAGMLLVGILAGPHILNFIPSHTIAVSANFRKLALAAILLGAVFQLHRHTLLIPPTLLIAIIPTIFEIGCIIFLAHLCLHLGWPEASILAIILSGVSLSVLVPAIHNLKEHGKAEIKSMTDNILASACLNNIFIIVIFIIFIWLYLEQHFTLVSIIEVTSVPTISGVLLGVGSGYCFYWLSYKYKFFQTSNRAAVLVIIFTSLLVQVEDLLNNIIPVASLLGVLVMGGIILEKAEGLAHAISRALDKFLIFAELLLFILIGAQVNIQLALVTSLVGLGIIASGLIVRSIAINVLTKGFGINQKQRVFYIACNLPKASVQAAIAAIPIEAGVTGGEIILAISVLAILVSTLIGALGINFTGEAFLEPVKKFNSRLGIDRGRIPPFGRYIRSKKDDRVFGKSNSLRKRM